MAKRKVDSKTKLFMDFFTKELGAKFVDAGSREEIEPIAEETNNGKSWFSISKKDEYMTPKEVVDFFGPFDYDPATTKEQAEYLGIPHYDTIETDGLKADWDAVGINKIWINPPFSSKAEFLAKAVKCWTDTGARICILLPIEYLTTKEFHEIIGDTDYHLYIPNGRIKFDDGSGRKSSPAFGSCAIEFGSHVMDSTESKRLNTLSHWRLYEKN